MADLMQHAMQYKTENQFQHIDFIEYSSDGFAAYDGKGGNGPWHVQSVGNSPNSSSSAPCDHHMLEDINGLFEWNAAELCTNAHQSPLFVKVSDLTSQL